MGGVARATGNLYDLDGNRIRVIHPDTSFFTYEVDGLGRPFRIRENGGDPIADFAYDSAGRRASSGWAATTSYAYDPIGRLQTLSHNLVGTSRDHDLGFAYNPASQIVSRSASNDAYSWTDPGRYVRSYAANGLNQYTGTASTGAANVAFLYDANGNLTSDGIRNYVYDVENRLVSASGESNAELVYDPLGRLFQVSSGGAGIRRLVYDGDALVAEYDSAGNMPHRYIHGNDAGDDPLIWYDNWAGGWRRALLTDHQGSVIQVADMYGNPLATNSYDPWGIPGAGNAGRFGYTGQTWVPELGLWYYKARFYSPTTGRFLQVDPVGYDDQINLYAYVGNDPVNGTDPSGSKTAAIGACPPGEQVSASCSGMSAFTDEQGGSASRSRAERQHQARDQAAAEAIYGETAGIYPGRNEQGEVIPLSAIQLESARRAIGLISERNPDVHRQDGSSSRNPLEAAQWDRAEAAARDRSRARIPPSAQWFFIRNRDRERFAPPHRPQLGRAQYFGTFGTRAPFRSVGGGDVGPGRNIVIDIYFDP